MKHMATCFLYIGQYFVTNEKKNQIETCCHVFENATDFCLILKETTLKFNGLGSKTQTVFNSEAVP